MLVPLSWLNEFVKVDGKNLKALMWKITEAGLTCEKFEEKEDDIVLDFEVTPNRPDWMSILGIAREISAITEKTLTVHVPQVKTGKIINPLEIKINPNYEIVPRITSVIIKNVNIKQSPQWLKKRIRQIGLRPINNVVDTTNYVLWIYGSLLHAFDYDKIKGHEMTIELSKGGEEFRSLDGINYALPKNAVIIKDTARIIDLLPLKGGENTQSTEATKTVLLHSVLCNSALTRKTSQALKLKSDSSVVAERGLDPNGTATALNHALSLILELTGGEIASPIIDHKAGEFNPANISLDLARLQSVSGISINSREVINILSRLSLAPKLSGNKINCTIPSYRLDLKIEEDIIEEVARIYGYNNFPKTLPENPPPVNDIAYKTSYEIEDMVKNIMMGLGFTETYTFSLVSEIQLNVLNADKKSGVKIENPVSREFEFARPTIIGNLLDAVKLNEANFESIKLFELGRIYKKSNLYEEHNYLSLVSTEKSFYDLKGILELILERLGIENFEFKNLEQTEISSYNSLTGQKRAVVTSGEMNIGVIGEVKPEITDSLGIKSTVYAAEMNFDLLKALRKIKKFAPLSLYPEAIEDITLTVQEKTPIGELIKSIYKTDSLVKNIKITSRYKNKITFRISFQSDKKNLTKEDTVALLKKIASIM